MGGFLAHLGHQNSIPPRIEIIPDGSFAIQLIPQH
jgi:hypothetical protein